MDCPHLEGVHYSTEHDNFYCNKCKKGMGNHFYFMAVALQAVAAGIWRDKESNTKGLAGGSLVVDLVERALSCIKE